MIWREWDANESLIRAEAGELLHSLSLNPSPGQLSCKCLPLVTGSTRQAGHGSGSGHIHHLSKCTTDMAVRLAAFSSDRDGRFAMKRCPLTASVLFLREAHMHFFFLMLQVNLPWQRLHDSRLFKSKLPGDAGRWAGEGLTSQGLLLGPRDWPLG